MSTFWNKSSFLFFPTFILALNLVGIVVHGQDEPKARKEKLTNEQTKFFESKIRPVLIRECYGCHSTKAKIKGGLWLDSREGVVVGGDSGAAVVPGNLNESLLWSAINYEDFKMPPGKKLSHDIISDFRQWIEMGAPDPRIENVAKVNTTITPNDILRGKQFWSFKKPAAPITPSITNTHWPRSKIDHFILSQLEQNKLTPNDDAAATTLLRRLTFDLIGLPPTPEQIAWIDKNWNKDREKAITHIVDSLLSKPEFGERWGRHWLDVARYAESTGKELNLTFPNAWRYRDYVIDSFNEDKPYNRFVQEQLAGDLLPIKTEQQWAENLIATGFLAIGPKTLTEQNARQFKHDLVDEQIDVATRVMLGVSVACARCHDHKFDPIPQADYYAMAGIFNNMTTHYGTVSTLQNRRSSNLVILPIDDLNPFDEKVSPEELASLKSQLAQKAAELNDYRKQRQSARQGSDVKFSIADIARTSALVGSLKNKIQSYDNQGNPLTYAMAVQSVDRPTNSRLLLRGEFDKPAQYVERGLPQVLVTEQPNITATSSGRLELARWVGSEENPLTARVMVNRVWQHMFGRGIVQSTENFGSTGQPPSHPELLDHLAVEFMNNGWSVKKLVREIAISRTYCMDSSFKQTNFDVDPENKLFWRMAPRRLDAEALRDSILAMSGDLDSNRPRASRVAEFGPGTVRDGALFSTLGTSNSKISGGFSMRGRPGSMGSGANPSGMTIAKIDQQMNYRSVYLPVVRQALPRALEVFDFAESSMVVGVRETSNTPDQGLYFLNNEFVLSQSDAIARRIQQEKSSLTDQIKHAFLLVYGRRATSNELRAVEKFYREFEVSRRSRLGRESTQKLSAVCQAILASAEFRYLN